MDLERLVSFESVAFSSPQRLLQQASEVAVAEQFRIGAHGAVAGHLVVLHALRRGDQTSVQDLGFRLLGDQLFAFLEQPLHALALFAFRRFAQLVKYLLQALDLALGLFQMLGETLLQLR